MTIFVPVLLLGGALAAWAAGTADAPTGVSSASVFDVDVAARARLARPPLGLPPLPDVADGPPATAAIALGRKLFFDRRLSRNGTMSCAMCHVPEQGFTNNELATPVGVEGRSLRRNAPTILNVAYVEKLFYDGREPDLETQALAPMIAPEEMANVSLGAVVSRIDSLPDYDGLFERAFGTGPSLDGIGRALAAWQRTLLAGNAPFDRWRYGGESDAMTPRQIEGYALFTGRAGCAGCHTINEDHALFTDQAFHDTGIGYRRDVVTRRETAPVAVQIAPGVSVSVPRAAIDSVGEPPKPDDGRMEVTERPEDRWRFRTPSLRNVALTAPYMHDGSLRTLEDVVRYYARGGEAHPGLDPAIRPLDLSEREVDALVAFLHALTGEGIDALVADARSVPVGN